MLQKERLFLEEDKNLVMNVQLSILSGHVLQAADASESMGFKVTGGDSEHINLESDSPVTKKLFDALSSGGKAGRALQEPFFGGAFSDRAWTSSERNGCSIAQAKRN